MRLGRRSLLQGAVGALPLVWAGRAAEAAGPAPAALRSRLKGRLILPGDEGYAQARRGASFGPAEDRRPAMIAQCADADDVARALEHARRAGIPVAVKSGGHDVLAACVNDGGLVIDLSGLAGIAIDAARRSASVQPGVRAGAFATAAGALGLAPVLGCNPGVGVAGLTLGGGLGWFLGSFGAACDNLLSAEVVLADGRRLIASMQEHPELFWALRGGGGNFGIVTRLTHRLHPVETVLAGMVAFRGDPRPFLRLYRDLMAEAPDALTVELSLTAGAPPTLMAICCWNGDAAEGSRVLRRLTQFDKPLAGGMGAIAYSAFAGQRVAPAAGNLFWRGGSLDQLSEAAIEQLNDILGGGRPGLSIGLGHYMHGRVVTLGHDATPLGRRKGQLSYFVGAGWREPAVGQAATDGVMSAMTALRPVSGAATYVNYLSDDSEAAVRAAYGAANYARLQALKGRYDPANVFRANRNIRPPHGAKTG